MNTTEIYALTYRNLLIAKKRRFSFLFDLFRSLPFIISLFLIGISLTNTLNNSYISFMVSGMALWLIFSTAFLGSATSYVWERHSLDSLNPLPFDKRSIYVAGGLTESIRSMPIFAVLLSFLWVYMPTRTLEVSSFLLLVGVGWLVAIQLGGLCALATMKIGGLDQTPRTLERVMFITSGAFYYASILPPLLHKIFWLMPHTQFIAISRDILINAKSLGQNMSGFGVLLTWLVLLSILQTFLKKHYELIEPKDR